jgi:DNA-binding NtrC family response regulator
MDSESWSALVVDDDPGVRQSLRLCLETDGAHVLGVGSAKAALEALERGRFDVVLLDVWLGPESGLDAIPDIVRRQPAASIIVIRHYLSRGRVRQHRPDVLFSAAADRAIRAYGWPGNLRELRNAIERALILCPGARIEPDDLGIPAAADDTPRLASGVQVALGADVSLEAMEREHIARVIARASTLEAAARTLGIDSTTLQRKRKRYRLTSAPSNSRSVIGLSSPPRFLEPNSSRARLRSSWT